MPLSRRAKEGRNSTSSTVADDRDNGDEPEPETSRKPKDTAFRQQRVKAWVPVLQPYLVMSLFAVIGIIFVPIGAYLMQQSKSVVEYSAKYDGDSVQAGLEACAVTDFGVNGTCVVTFNVQKDMQPPIYVYYELTKLLQNHRRYVKSRSAQQLIGETLLPDSNCEPLRTTPGGTPLNPCGLIANSLFTDTFTVTDGPTMSETGIAWAVDRSDRFQQPTDFKRALCPGSDCEACLGSGIPFTEANACKLVQYEGRQWAYWYPSDDTIQYLYETYPDNISPIEGVTNEHFMVWMRTAGMPDFRKVYGRIDTAIRAGTSVTFQIDARYYVTGFGGTKSIVLATVSKLGGKNVFLGAAYLALGALSLVICLAFGIKHWLSPRKLGDTRFLVMSDTE